MKEAELAKVFLRIDELLEQWYGKQQLGQIALGVNNLNMAVQSYRRSLLQAVDAQIANSREARGQ